MRERAILIVATLLGLSAASLTLAIEYTGSRWSVALLLPGIFGSIVFSGNVHAFHLWLAALVNFTFYFLLCWIAGSLLRKVLRRRVPQ
jgi:hypothetical protein